MSRLTILNQHGDQPATDTMPLVWDKVLEDAVEEALAPAALSAKAAFDTMRDEGKYLAYKRDDKGEFEVIREFDATAEEIFMTPQSVGG